MHDLRIFLLPPSQSAFNSAPLTEVEPDGTDWLWCTFWYTPPFALWLCIDHVCLTTCRHSWSGLQARTVCRIMFSKLPQRVWLRREQLIDAQSVFKYYIINPSLLQPGQAVPRWPSLPLGWAVAFVLYRLLRGIYRHWLCICPHSQKYYRMFLTSHFRITGICYKFANYQIMYTRYSCWAEFAFVLTALRVRFSIMSFSAHHTPYFAIQIVVPCTVTSESTSFLLIMKNLWWISVTL